MARIPWLGLATPLGLLGTQIDKPLSTYAFIASCAMTMIYSLFHIEERKKNVDSHKDVS